MAYTKQIWENENPSSQLNETRLNHIEDGIANAYNVSLIAISGTAPSECSTGDMYYNTTDNKIYTATATDTWGEVGTTPISDKTYVLVTDNTTYAYLNGTLEQIGGSEQEVENEYSESTTDAYSCDYSNNNFAKKYICASESDRWTQTFTSWTATPLKISNAETNDSSMFILDSVNRKITIGAGVSKIKVSAQVSWNNANASGEFDIRIEKNGSSAYQIYNNTTTGIENLTVSSFILEVEENDYIQLCAFGGISSAQILTTNLLIEKME